MDVLNAFEGSVRIGKDNNMTNVVEPQLHVAPCDPGRGRCMQTMRHMRCTTTLTRGSVRQAQRKRRRSHSCIAYHHLSSATRWRMARVWRNENRMQETSEGEPFVPCSFVYFWIHTHFPHRAPTRN